MSQMQQARDLEIDDDLQFQQKSWKVQRMAWVLLILLLLAGSAGLFGGYGPLAEGRAGDDTGALRVQYKRFTQYLTPVNFQIQARVPEGAGDSLRLWIDRQYLEEFTVLSITPQPDKVESAPDRLIYEFPLAETDGVITITLNVRYNRAGVLNGRLGLDGGETLEFSQFVYP